MLITDGGTLIRTAVDGISVVGRNTQGVRLIRIGDDERLVEIERVATTGTEDDDAEEDAEESASSGADNADESESAADSDDSSESADDESTGSESSGNEEEDSQD